MSSITSILPRLTKEDITPEVIRRFGDVHMSEEEFVEWCSVDLNAEWADGEVILMPPTSADHNDLQGWLSATLRHFVEHHGLGRVFGPEFMIRLAKQRRRRTPDLLFVAKDRVGLIKKNHFEGAPDLVIEIVSPESESRDWREKYLDYEAAGVREYWIIDPMSEHIEVYVLGKEGKYEQIAASEGKIASKVIPGWYIRPTWLFSEARPTVLAVLPELGIR
jgi:Uma2 family endonuclease